MNDAAILPDGETDLNTSTGSLERYRSATDPLPAANRLWPLYGAGWENLGDDGAYIERPLPAPGPDELLVRHDAVGICFSDIKVIRTGDNHPRIYHPLHERPAVLGHEVSLTIIEAGEHLREQYHPGDRFIVQADIYINDVSYAYGYEIQGGFSRYNIVDQRVLNGDHGNYLLPVQPTTGYAEAALSEPWACVEASYTVPYRVGWKPGGTVLITGEGAGVTLGTATGWRPAAVVSTAGNAQINAELAEWRMTNPPRADSIFNGADDDGSGSMSVLEIAEYMASMKVKPKRSTLFVWHVGEEKGLWGSAWFTDHPTIARDSIVAQLNLDMVGRGNAWDVTGATKEGAVLHGSPDYLQVVGSRRLSTELGDLVDKVNTTGKHNFNFDLSLDANGHPMNIYCRSDHYEYARYGIPVAFFTTGGHSDYHQLTDEAQYLNYPHMARIGKFVADLAVTIGNRATRLTVDQAKPNPKGVCQQ